MTYGVGQTVELTRSFTVTATGDPVDPATVQLRLRSPAGTVTTINYPDAALVKDSVGHYRALVVPDSAGEWVYEWQSTDPTSVSYPPGQFTVRGSAITDGPGVVPSVDDVAALLYARTYVDGVARGTFDADTYPTGADVQVLCDTAAQELLLSLSGTVPADLVDDARRIASYKAAVLVEQSFFPTSEEFDPTSARQILSASYIEQRSLLQERLGGIGSTYGFASVPVRSAYAQDSGL